MSEYDPQYEWFSTLEKFESDTPDYISNGDSFFNQQLGCNLTLHSHGGCAGGLIQSLYEFTTFIREGWFVNVKVNPANRPIYSGKVGQRQHTYQGLAQIPVYGFIRDFNGYLSKDMNFTSMPGSEAVERLANEVYEDPTVHFLPNSVFRYIYQYVPGDIAEISHLSPSLNSIRSEMRDILVAK